MIGSDSKEGWSNVCRFFYIGLCAFGAQAVRFQYIVLPIVSLFDTLDYTWPFCALLDQLTISGNSDHLRPAWNCLGLSWDSGTSSVEFISV